MRLVLSIILLFIAVFGFGPIAAALVETNLAAAMGDIEQVRSLIIANPSRLEERTSTGMTPLMSAAASGEIEVVRFLISRSANLNALDNQGWTALEHAKRNNHQDLASFLAKSETEQP